MSKGESLKKDNRGASLLAVLVVLITVTAIAVIITKLTITNIQMKEVERGTKKNFYSAESVMDELYAGVSALAAEDMGTAYQDVLENYLNYTAVGDDLQKVFTRKYLEQLETTFGDGSTPNTKMNGTEIIYSISKYSTDTVKGCMSLANQPCFQTSASDASYDADYEAGTFTLKNVKVTYEDAQGYETTITADLHFTTPTMNFNGGNQIKEFMKYCLIADQQIEANAFNISVTGSVYAGTDGIVAKTNGDAAFTGKMILTRGPIATEGSSKLTIGDGSSAIWAENIQTTGKSASEISVSGNCYVEDDLSLDGLDSTVTLSGNYYGYNFQENYAAKTETKDAKFSSAMMINAKDCKLDLSGLNYLMLAGRTFISRGNGAPGVSNSDVLLGESISARTNQLAYYVPKEYVDAGTRRFTGDGIVKFQIETGISNVANYLDSTYHVVPYYYIDRGNPGVTSVNYYLNFKDEQSANDYFAAYCSGVRGNTIGAYAANYVTDDAIVLDAGRILTLKGDIMYRNMPDEALQEMKAVIGADWNEGGAFYAYSSQLARKYKSLQLGLTETRPGVTEADVRLKDAAGNIDKSVDPMFDELIDRTALVAEIAANSSSGEYVIDISGSHVVLVDNDGLGAGAYSIPASYTDGIIVATGDVYVPATFTGLIISGGTISFADNAVVGSDDMLVSKLFSEDMAAAAQRFSHLFRNCGSGSGPSYISGNVDFSTYLTYENWKKN